MASGIEQLPQVAAQIFDFQERQQRARQEAKMRHEYTERLKTAVVLSAEQAAEDMSNLNPDVPNLKHQIQTWIGNVSRIGYTLDKMGISEEYFPDMCEIFSTQTGLFPSEKQVLTTLQHAYSVGVGLQNAANPELHLLNTTATHDDDTGVISPFLFSFQLDQAWTEDIREDFERRHHEKKARYWTKHYPGIYIVLNINDAEYEWRHKQVRAIGEGDQLGGPSLLTLNDREGIPENPMEADEQFRAYIEQECADIYHNTTEGKQVFRSWVGVLSSQIDMRQKERFLAQGTAPTIIVWGKHEGEASAFSTAMGFDYQAAAWDDPDRIVTGGITRGWSIPPVIVGVVPESNKIFTHIGARSDELYAHEQSYVLLQGWRGMVEYHHQALVAHRGPTEGILHATEDICTRLQSHETQQLLGHILEQREPEIISRAMKNYPSEEAYLYAISDLCRNTPDISDGVWDIELTPHFFAIRMTNTEEDSRMESGLLLMEQIGRRLFAHYDGKATELGTRLGLSNMDLRDRNQNIDLGYRHLFQIAGMLRFWSLIWNRFEEVQHLTSEQIIMESPPAWHDWLKQKYGDQTLDFYHTVPPHYHTWSLLQQYTGIRVSYPENLDEVLVCDTDAYKVWHEREKNAWIREEGKRRQYE